jgi:general secretion pathway protein C
VKLTAIRGNIQIPKSFDLEKVMRLPGLPLIVNLVLAVALGYGIVQSGWKFWLQWHEKKLPEAEIPADVLSGQYNIQALASAFLFGRPPVDEKLQIANPAVIPITTLNIILTGVFLRHPVSFALMSVNGQPEGSYAVDEEIMPGTRVKMVFPEHILISRSGVTEKVLLKDTTPQNPGSMQTVYVPPAPAPLPATPAPGQKIFNVERDQISKNVTNPDILRQALMVPNPGGGFQVKEIQAGSVYEQLGLKAGDVVRTINGQEINRMDDVMKLYRQFKGSGQKGEVVVDISRAGKPEQLKYNIR